MNKFLFSTAIGSMLLLGACATSPAKVAPEYVSAKQFIYAECNEMSEEMAKAQYELRVAKGKEKIAIAKGQYDAIVRAGYSKHCGDARYSDRAPQRAPAQPQIIVIQPNAAPTYQPQQYQQQYQQPAQPRYEYKEKLAPYYREDKSDDWDTDY